MKKKFSILFKDKFIFIFFIALVFVAYKDLFNHYFEADEWPGFASNLPLTRDPLGFLKILVSGGGDSATIVQSQHIVPVAKELFFLSTLFFGTNFVPYAFISLLLHSINSFLIFILIRLLLPRKKIFAFLGGLFFALAPTQMHAITWAATYETSILPTTLFLLSIISFKMAFLKESKKFIYFSVAFLLLSLLAKETTFFLFVLLPIMAIFEKRIFSLKFLGKIFLFFLIVYVVFRFLIPGIYSLPYLKVQQPKVQDTGTIVSRDLSIYKNLPAEVLLRTITFPLRMTGTIFMPRETIFTIVQFITPVIVPLSVLGDYPSAAGFLNSTGDFVIIYLASLVIVIFCTISIAKFVRQKRVWEAQTLTTGLAIILLGALPLVPIVFSFPRWGFDFYFDSRYYYNPGVGAAIVFPFLLFGIAKFISRLFNVKSFSAVVSIVFLIWLINNMYVFGLTTSSLMNIFGPQRREIISQVQTYLPTLPKKTVFYFQTDGESAFGPVLPFYTSVPQAIGNAYYNKSPLPGDLLTNPLNGKSEGYSSSHGRGLGYYMSKKSLSEDLVLGKFASSDIYAFYYYAKEVKIKDIKQQVRSEMNDYLKTTDRLDWKIYEDAVLKIKFLYPKSSSIEVMSDVATNVIKSLLISDSKFSATISFINVSPSFDIHEVANFLNQKAVVADKDVSFDKYHSNKVTLVQADNFIYYIRMTNALIQVKTDGNNPGNVLFIERILGSLENL